MASVDFKNGKKKTATDVAATMRHDISDERIKHKHSNLDIDLSKTHTNISFGFLNSYERAFNAYKDRIAFLDSTTNTNHRTDRVTMFSLVIYAPEHLPDYQIDEWASCVNDILKEFSGPANHLGMAVHKDEVHEYTDPITHQLILSRVHIHSYEIPEINGTLVGKQYSSRARINEINHLIHDMTKERFGVDFLNGKESKNQSVQRLKSESLRAEIEEKEKKNSDLENCLERNKKELRIIKNVKELSSENNCTISAGKVTMERSNYDSMMNSLLFNEERYHLMEKEAKLKNDRIKELERECKRIQYEKYEENAKLKSEVANLQKKLKKTTTTIKKYKTIVRILSQIIEFASKAFRETWTELMSLFKQKNPGVIEEMADLIKRTTDDHNIKR